MKCLWTKRAVREYQKVLTYVYQEFGEKAAFDFVDNVDYWDGRIAQYPEIGAPERLLAGRKKHVYHSLIVSKHNKVIYTIDANGIVTILDLWDMRRHPAYLSGRIKTK